MRKPKSRLDYSHFRRKRRLREIEKFGESKHFCPTPGCYDSDNNRIKYKWHYTRHSCPLNDANIMRVTIGQKK